MALPIMGKQQSWDNAWDISAMSTYNTITSLSESPLKEGLIYAGTDDGLIQVTEDGGKNWTSVELGSIKDIPSTAFVNDIRADLFDESTVYAALDNHKFGDFRPYLIKSTDKGKSWSSITGDLPDRTLVWRLVQDHDMTDLLFLATEFGIYFTVDAGVHWTELGGGVPTISFRDITIQRRENDLVAASFGRGFFILDDITPLKEVSADLLQKEAALFPVKDAWWYVPRNVVSSQGAADYRADNPPFGAIFTYYLKKEYPNRRKQRMKREKELDKEGAQIPFPGWEELEKESLEEGPTLVFTIRDELDQVVNNLITSPKKGINRVSWNLRYASKRPIRMEPEQPVATTSGYLVPPGSYTVSLSLVQDGATRELNGPLAFNVVPLYQGALAGPGVEQRDGFRIRLLGARQELQKAQYQLNKAGQWISAMKRAYFSLDREDPELLTQIDAMEKRQQELGIAVNGYRTKEEIGEKQHPTPASRIGVAQRGLSTTYGPTATHWETLETGIAELEPLQRAIQTLVETELPALQEKLESAGAPWIMGQ